MSDKSAPTSIPKGSPHTLQPGTVHNLRPKDNGEANDKEHLTSAKQWTYIGHTFGLPGNGNSITPMVGAIHSWKFDQDVDLAMGCYYSHKNINLYAWANDILTEQPRFVVAVEFSFSNK